MPSIVNSLIHHSSQRLHIETSSSGFLLDWNKRGHWQQWRSYRGRLGSTAIHQTVWCTFIHWEIRCFFIRLNPTTRALHSVLMIHNRFINFFVLHCKLCGFILSSFFCIVCLGNNLQVTSFGFFSDLVMLVLKINHRQMMEYYWICY